MNAPQEFKGLRLTDETIYLCNVEVDLINGMVYMSFSCDAVHCIDHHAFFTEPGKFDTPGQSADGHVQRQSVPQKTLLNWKSAASQAFRI